MSGSVEQFLFSTMFILLLFLGVYFVSINSDNDDY